MKVAQMITLDGAKLEPLLAMEAEVNALESAMEFATDDEEIDALGRRLDALEIEISQTEAKTPAGVAVKIRRIWQSLAVEPEEWDLKNYKTILNSLEKLHASQAMIDSEH